MRVFSHRVNTVKELLSTDRSFGVEVDLRAGPEGRIILAHDPFVDGEDFSEYLKSFSHNGIILNIKCDGIERSVIEILEKHKITDYLFLDTSLPTFYDISSKGNNRFFVRYSSIEPLELAVTNSQLASWVWVDCFEDLILTKQNVSIIKKHGLKICLVSPELHGREDSVKDFIEKLQANNLKIDAVCTKSKFISSWSQLSY